VAIAGGSASEGGIRALCDEGEPSSFAFASESVAGSADAAVEDARFSVLLGIRASADALEGGGGGGR
jgi:hypothetical protein